MTPDSTPSSTPTEVSGIIWKSKRWWILWWEAGNHNGTGMLELHRRTKRWSGIWQGAIKQPVSFHPQYSDELSQNSEWTASISNGGADLKTGRGRARDDVNCFPLAEWEAVILTGSVCRCNYSIHTHHQSYFILVAWGEKFLWSGFLGGLWGIINFKERGGDIQKLSLKASIF